MAIDGSLPGQNTVGSADIINGEVQADDLKAESIGSGKLADRQVKNADLGLGASSSNTIADGGIESIDVKNNNLTGGDIANGSVENVDLSSPVLGGPVAFGAFGGTCMSDEDCPMESSQGADLDRIDGGLYCIDTGGAGSVIVLGNWWGDGALEPDGVTGIDPDTPFFCEAGQFAVLTTNGDNHGFSFVIF